MLSDGRRRHTLTRQVGKIPEDDPIWEKQQPEEDQQMSDETMVLEIGPKGCEGSTDGVTVTQFEPGSTATFSTEPELFLANVFLKQGWAKVKQEPAPEQEPEPEPEPAAEEPETKQIPEPENKQKPKTRRRTTKARSKK